MYILQPLQMTTSIFKNTSNNINWDIYFSDRTSTHMDEKGMNSTTERTPKTAIQHANAV
jgi:hypothetical protein